MSRPDPPDCINSVVGRGRGLKLGRRHLFSHTTPTFPHMRSINLVALYITLSDLVYNGRHTCLLNPLKYSQTCTEHGRSDRSALCKLAVQLALSVAC